MLLTPGFPRSEEDSTTIPALQIYVKALKENSPNLDIKIISFQYPFVLKKYDWFGVTVFPLNGSNKKYKKLFIWQKAKRLLEKINQKKTIEVIHSFWIGECAFVGEKFSKKRQIKHLITAMGQDVFIRNRYLKYIYNNENIITLSNNQHRFLKEISTLESKTIPWGINPKNFPKPQEKSIAILGVGSLNEIKNFSLFIKIISKLKKRVQHLQIEIIGDGKYKQQLIQEIRVYKLQDVILLKGELSRTKVLEKMAKAKILLHTSNYESFGMVFLEALQSNMKIVSFDVGFAEDSPSWFVCKTENEMVKKLDLAIRNFQLTTQKTTYTINETVQKYSKIYNE